MKPCVIIGSGGHAKVVIDILRLMGRTISFATTKNFSAEGNEISGIPIVGDDTYLDAFGPDKVDLALGVGAPKLGNLRQSVWSSFETKGYHPVTLIHPSAIVSPEVVIGDGAQIMAGSVIQPGCRIGSGAIINTGATIDHDCHVEPFAHIAPGVTLCGNVTVGENSLIGAGATVIPGITIGSNCLVAAGAIVNKQADQA